MCEPINLVATATDVLFRNSRRCLSRIPLAYLAVAIRSIASRSRVSENNAINTANGSGPDRKYSRGCQHHSSGSCAPEGLTPKLPPRATPAGSVFAKLNEASLSTANDGGLTTHAGEPRVSAPKALTRHYHRNPAATALPPPVPTAQRRPTNHFHLLEPHFLSLTTLPFQVALRGLVKIEVIGTLLR